MSAMSYILDMTKPHARPADDQRSFTTNEISTWASLVLILVTTAWYVIVIAPQLSTVPVDDIEWQVPLLWAVGISIVGAIVIAIVLSIGTAIVTRQEPEGGDIRDKQIDRHGTRVGLAIMAGGSVLALVLAMLEVHVFWIGNAVFLIAALGTVIGQIVSLRAYHGVFRG